MYLSYKEDLYNKKSTEQIFVFSDSEKFHEMALATETPPKQCFLLDDDGDFPPIGGHTNKSDSTD